MSLNSISTLTVYSIMDIIFFIILAMVLFQIKFTNTKILYHFEFGKCIFYSLMLCITDLWIVALDTIRPDLINLHNIVYILYLIWFTCTGYNFFIFFGKMVNYDKTESGTIRSLFMLPFLIASFANIHHFNTYLQALFVVFYSIIYACTVLKLTFYIIKSKNGINERLKFLSFPTIPFIVANVHVLFPAIPIIGGVVLAVCITYTECLHLLITTDPLTKINNRHYLQDVISNKIKKVSDSQNVYTLMIDINKFKSINDTYGHSEGDKCLIKVAKILKNICNELCGRPFICRYGGDEFLLVLEGDDDLVNAIADRITFELEDYNKNNEYNYNLSVSIGISHYVKNKCCSAKDIINEADTELYKAKRLYHDDYEQNK